MAAQVFFVTLNWNTTALLQTMVGTVEDTTPEPHTWIIVDNGSEDSQRGELLAWAQQKYGTDYFVTRPGDREHWVWARESGAKVVIVLNPENAGLILGHNLAFDVCQYIADGGPHEIVMVDTDVEVYERGWLKRVHEWADKHPEIGIIGMEHSGPAELVDGRLTNTASACAPAVFIEPGGHWYLHEEQTLIAEPAEGETVGLGMALIRWPVLEVGLRFDPGFKLYGCQDDDLCFAVRFELGLQVWVYPVDMWHRGSVSLKDSGYKMQSVLGDIDGQAQWNEKIRGPNQRYFAKKWAWLLGNPRANMAEERMHLEAMRARMKTRRVEMG